MVITVTVNVPLNDAIKAAGDPATIDVAAVREAFSESRWVAGTWCGSGSTSARSRLWSIALVLHGRAGA